MKKNIKYLVLLVVLLLFGCEGLLPTDTYKWNNDEEYHWKENEQGDKKGYGTHNFVNCIIVKEPTCTEDGEEYCVCNECEYEMIRIIKKTEHNFINGICKCGLTEENEIYYTVEFFNSEIENINIKEGDKILRPEDPYKKDFTFLGWFVDYECIVEYDFETVVSDNINLYAKWQYNYEYKRNNKEIIITKYVGNESKVNFPSTINDYKVVEISEYVIDHKENVTSIVIPDSVRRISASAFSDCNNISNISVDERNSTYDSRNNCNGIIITETNELLIGCKNTIIPNTVTILDSSAFCGCEGLISIYIPANVSYIGENIFDGCINLTEIIVDPNNEVYDSRENCNAIIRTSSNQLEIVCKNTTIPTTVKIIKDFAFSQCYGLKSIHIPGNVKEIGRGAFNECINLETVTIDDGVEYMYDGVFSGCESLSNIKLPSTINIINYYLFENCKNLKLIELSSNIESIESYAFSNCENLNNFIIPESVTSIGEYAFSNCENLNNFIISESVIRIGNGAFKGCESLTEVFVPKNTTDIGTNLFENCINLEKIEVDADNKLYDSRNNCNAIIKKSNSTLISGCSKTIIPDNVEYIGDCAFSGCINLVNVLIPANIKTIGYNAFFGCENIKSIYIPAQVTKINRGAFKKCSSLISIIVDENNTIYDSRNNCNAIIETESNELLLGCVNTIIPQGITTIGYEAFYGCKGLESIIIPNSVITIKASAFSRCESLTSIKIPNSVTSIGMEAFSGCINLTYITIPENVSRLEDYIFSGCISLKEFTISNNITVIGYHAFYDCKSLKEILIPFKVSGIGKEAFYGCDNLTIYCEISKKGAGWDNEWNSSNCEVVWGYWFI